MRTFKIIGLIAFILVTILGWGITYYMKNYKFNKICYKAYPTIEDQVKNKQSFNDCLISMEDGQRSSDNRMKNIYLWYFISSMVVPGIGYLFYKVFKTKQT